MMTRLISRRPRRSALPVLRDLRSFDQLLDEFWHGFGVAPFWSAMQESCDFTPRVNVEESDEEIVVSAELPGLEEKDFDISLEDEILTIKGEKRTESEEKREGFQHLETRSGSFERRLRLPCEIDAEKVKATYKNGVVKVVLPKPPEAQKQVRAIPVSTA